MLWNRRTLEQMNKEQRKGNRGTREEKRIGEGKIENGGLRNEKCQRLTAKDQRPLKAL